MRCLARNMAGAAQVPIVEFTISDTFAAPVGNVLASLPKVPVDTDERRQGYLARLHGLEDMLATVTQRHKDGRPAGPHGGDPARRGRHRAARTPD